MGKQSTPHLLIQQTSTTTPNLKTQANHVAATGIRTALIQVVLAIMEEKKLNKQMI